MNKKEKSKLSVEETINITNGTIEKYNIIFELKHIYTDRPPEYDTVEFPVDAEIYKRLPKIDNDIDAFFRFVDKYLVEKGVIANDDNTFVTRYIMVSGDSKAKVPSRETIENERKKTMDCIVRDLINFDNMTEADYVEEYEKHRKDTLRVLCEIYSISRIELLRFLHKNFMEKSRRMYECEFLAKYGEPLFNGGKGMEVVDGGTICDKPLNMERYGIKDDTLKGMVEVFCTPKDDTDKLATEVSIRGRKIYPPKGMLIGKITPIDNSFFVEFVEKDDYIKNYRDKLNDVGLTGSEKDIIVDTNNKMTKAGFPPCEVSDIMSDTPSPKGEINYLDKGNRADKPNNLTSLSVENRDNLLGELKGMLNRYGIDTICNTPDFILSDALLDTIYSIEKLQKNTNWWFGRKHDEIIMEGKTEDVKYLRQVIDKLWSILDDIDTYADLKIADTDPNNPFRKIRHKSAERFKYVKSDGYHLFIDDVQIDDLPVKE